MHAPRLTPNGKVRFTIYLPPSVAEALRRAAALSYMTQSYVVEDALIKHFSAPPWDRYANAEIKRLAKHN